MSSKFENKKYIILAIIGAIILISTIISVRFYDDSTLDNVPEGVGPIGSEHTHGVFAVLLDWKFVDFNPMFYDKYANANNYIFMLNDDSYNVIHRHTANATMGMFFDSFDINYSDNCFIIPPDTRDVKRETFEILEYCNEGDEKIRLFVNGKLNEEGPNYIIQDFDQLLLAYDNKTKTERNYTIGG